MLLPMGHLSWKRSVLLAMGHLSGENRLLAISHLSGERGILLTMGHLSEESWGCRLEEVVGYLILVGDVGYRSFKRRKSGLLTRNHLSGEREGCWLLVI